MKLKTYYKANSIEETVDLLQQSKRNIVLGGGHWLKMSSINYQMGIDISQIGLSAIDIFDDRIEIGADVSLRALEINPHIKEKAGILCQAVSAIVGVQFRNTAKIGASVYSRFGFSDIMTALMTLDAEVEIDGKEKMPVAVYMTTPRKRHFVSRIIIKIEEHTYAYQAMRHNRTSLPYMIVAMSRNVDNQWRICVGARPQGAKLADKTMAYLNTGGQSIEKVLDIFEEEVSLATNTYASKEYRNHLAKVFVKRGVEKLWK
jgi:CO/xanthine dehydrogenase FAD-binding subunit